MKTSIVIPNWFTGKPGRVVQDVDEAFWFAQNCFKRVKKFTNVSYELILIDNGSVHGQDMLRKYADILIVNKTNLGFARACNQGFEKATGDYICCMNNDIFVWDGWLEQMIKDYESDGNIGVIMPALMKQTKNGKEALKFETIDLSQNKGIVSPGAEFGSCWLIKKSFFDELKDRAKCEKFPDGYYFDPTFFPGFGEDRDLWDRVRLAGKDTYRTHNVRVFHQGNVTICKFPNRKKYTSANRKYLEEKRRRRNN